MSMKQAKVAVCCGSEDCVNNANRRETECCCYCGRCAACYLHDNCNSAAGGMKTPEAAVCGGGDDCMNSENAVKTLSCKACGRCGDCTLHAGCNV